MWPGEPTADAVRSSGRGTCASKHALLAEKLDALGVRSLPLLVVGPLVPDALAREADCREGLGLREVHECLTVLLPWAGPALVDVTWDPALVAHGLEATLAWSGDGDMKVAVAAEGTGWAVDRATLRSSKEALRRRLYSAAERERRDRVLSAISSHFARWRG